MSWLSIFISGGDVVSHISDIVLGGLTLGASVTVAFLLKKTYDADRRDFRSLQDWFTVRPRCVDCPYFTKYYGTNRAQIGSSGDERE